MSDGGDNWRTRAACHDEVDLFNTTFEQSYPPDAPDTPSIRAARKVCAACTVAADCLLWALETGAEFGVWGGTTPPERESLAPIVRRLQFDTHSFGTDLEPIDSRMRAS
ncbi:WhiB family transcriptional regulator [Frankia sp. AgW1.1]|uniref:WhiB family transcriptional regulator n=1 Tax=Frankia sp. AgW1.1 TaxID=1836971 RepID=UPI001933FC22|nr:WhiB family transcriptional regulator [Frankia sp. AgW1.1]MBL7487142.1 WhiB family transcriptional regulator [Frankia sp. AgW1.1]